MERAVQRHVTLIEGLPKDIKRDVIACDDFEFWHAIWWKLQGRTPWSQSFLPVTTRSESYFGEEMVVESSVGDFFTWAGRKEEMDAVVGGSGL